MEGPSKTTFKNSTCVAPIALRKYCEKKPTIHGLRDPATFLIKIRILKRARP